jgi:hypothetical protein
MCAAFGHALEDRDVILYAMILRLSGFVLRFGEDDGCFASDEVASCCDSASANSVIAGEDDDSASRCTGMLELMLPRKVLVREPRRLDDEWQTLIAVSAMDLAALSVMAS